MKYFIITNSLTFPGKDLQVDKEREIYVEDFAPPYLSLHSVIPANWSYLPFAQNFAHCMAFSMPPPYHTTKKMSLTKIDGTQQPCDRNMNTTMSNQNHKIATLGMDDFGFDIHSVLSMEILEGTKGGSGGGGVGNGGNINGLIEAKNEEVLKRVAEMQKMVESSERYLNEQCELMDEYEQTPLRVPWSNVATLDVDSDTESLASSKLSSNEDAPPPGVLKHSDSLILLAESINHDLSGITKGLNLITDDSETKSSSLQGTPKTNRRAQGLSQILSELQSLGNDLSQSESDSESVSTPNNSPIRLRSNQEKSNINKIRTSFGLHSPDSILGDTKDNNLKDYLRQLREASTANAENESTDLAAKKLKELYGFELTDETIIETDTDLIDLRAIPPPQTPDELDAFTVLDAPPTGFGDETTTTTTTTKRDSGNLEEFLAKVLIAPPGQKITPCKELTPEEIMSFIIPPPPELCDTPEFTHKHEYTRETEPFVPKHEKQSFESHPHGNHANGNAIVPKEQEEQLYINSIQTKRRFFENHIETAKQQPQSSQQSQPAKALAQVIEYATVGRKGPFSCCTKSKKDDSPPITPPDNNLPLELPPKNVHTSPTKPPMRPPKNPELQSLMGTLPRHHRPNGNIPSVYDMDPTPPLLPPRVEDFKPVIVAPPKKPPLPPVPIKPILKSPIPIFKHTNSHDGGSPVRVAGIGSPHLHRSLNAYQKIDRAFTHTDEQVHNNFDLPVPAPRSNGHFRSLSDCPPVCLKNPGPDKKPQLSLLCSPQLTRKSSTGSVPGSPLLSNKNGHIVNPETLLQKTTVAMDGLLVKLDQVAANCSAAQSAGGGNCINEHQYQISRDQLTEQGLQLVSASKLLVVSLSDSNLTSLPENLTACLTAFRSITELARDLSQYTSTPLQTRNIVLKVHDVASSFRELVSVKIGPLGAGQLALQAECLANALASLLRSLRVFSP